LNVCYSSASATQTVALYAFEKGIYADHGLDVNLVYISGGSKATLALVAGDMDICQIAGSAIINAVVSGIELQIIAGLINTYPYTLMVTPDIQTAEDLKGKVLAVSTFGGAADVTTRTLLNSLGLESDKDVAILSIGGQSERIASMNSGQISGTLTGLLQTAFAKKNGFKELTNMKDLNLPYQHTALAASREFITEHRATVIHFLEATIEAIGQMKEDHAGVVEVISKYYLLESDENLGMLEEVVRELTLDFLPAFPYPTTEGVQGLLNALKESNGMDIKVTPSDIIDSTLLNEIRY
jgi:NitT/TauT family transport system substrate-binding protein